MAISERVYGLKNKVGIVTGGGSGIGKGIALEMAKFGASLVVADADPEAAESTVEEIRAMGTKALKVVADCTKSESVGKIIEKTLEEFRTIDILINNVGGALGVRGSVSFLEISEEFWDNIIDVNMKSTFLFTKAFTKVIINEKKQGSIINISSLADRVPWVEVPIYGAAKAGISNFTQNMAIVLGKYKIRVNAVCPGRIETKLSEALWENRLEERKAQVEAIPLGRFGTPEDVGRVVVFLVSDAASYVSGSTILVTGGLTQLLF
jgi:NAD(P)-dependent dehydrogenase (short-subunit alcohol dehydrogenase family)